jgi:aminomethyltransferase
MAADEAPRPSPLSDRHRGLGARTTAFAGWEMPLHYGSVVAEHRAVRTACGVFDLSHLGKLVVRGPGAVAALQYAFTNDVTRLSRGRAHYTLCLNDDGGVVDDLLLYRLDWGYLVICNAANVAAVLAAIVDSPGDPEVDDVTGDFACLAVQGPTSPEVTENAGLDVRGMAFLDCRPLAVPGPVGATNAPPEGPELLDGMIARSGYTGERGYEIVVPIDRGGDLWDRVISVADVSPVGLGARDTLRLEMGYALHGNDIDTTTNPVAAGLGFAVAADTTFRGVAAIRAAQQERPPQRLRGLRATERGVPRAGQRVLSDGTVVGRTTSGSFSPTLECGIALAYLDTAVGADAEVEIDVRGRGLPARVVRPPFVDADPRD